MSQSNIKSFRVSLDSGMLILDALFMHCGSDSDALEAQFYSLNPLVVSLHIIKPGEYLLPFIAVNNEPSEAEGLLLWG